MPIIRLTKKDPDVGVVAPEDDMILTFVKYDDFAYQFDWTGRTGLLPLDAVERAINRQIAGKDFRQIWIATDGKFDWAGDKMQILTQRLAPRLTPAHNLSNRIVRVGVASPYDRVSFLIAAKTSEYAIDIFINPLSDGDSGRSEFLQVNPD